MHPKATALLLSAACLLLSLIASGQPAIQWQKSLGGNQNEFCYDMQQTQDSGYILIGTSKSATGHLTRNCGDYDVWLVKLSASGTIDWQRSLGGSGEDVGMAVVQQQDGSYLVTATTASNDSDVAADHGGKDIWLMKLSPSGSLLWQKLYGGSGDDLASTLKSTTDRGIILAGSTSSSNGDVTGQHGNYDYWVVKLDSAGVIEWQKALGGAGNDYATGLDIADSGYVVSGYTTSTDGDVTGQHGGEDYWVVKLSGAGAIVWQKALGGAADEFADDIIRTSSGEYLVVGGSNSVDGDVSGSKGAGDYWVVKLSATGALQWQKRFGGSADDAAVSAIQKGDGNYIITGWVASYDGDVTGHKGSSDYWLIELTPSGSMVWQKTFGSPGINVAQCLRATNDGQLAVVGHTYYGGGDITISYGQSDIWFAKLGGPVALAETAVQQLRVFPNPATDEVTIEEGINYNMAIYNSAGVEIDRASHTKTMSVRELAPGNYHLVLTDPATGTVKQTATITKR